MVRTLPRTLEDIVVPHVGRWQLSGSVYVFLIVIVTSYTLIYTHAQLTDCEASPFELRSLILQQFNLCILCTPLESAFIKLCTIFSTSHPYASIYAEIISLSFNISIQWLNCASKAAACQVLYFIWTEKRKIKMVGASIPALYHLKNAVWS